MEFKVKNKIIEIKFDYRTMFKVDKQLATKNKDTGASNNDGVGTLFNNILNRNDEGLVDLILLSANKAFSKAISEDDAITAIETWLVDNDADDTESLFEEIQQEMVDSGFFKNKILKYIGNFGNSSRIHESARGQRSASSRKLPKKLIGKMKSATILTECARLGLTDLETIYSCNKWELDAILEGLHYRQIDFREKVYQELC